MSITKCLAFQNSSTKIILLEKPCLRSIANHPFNPISGFPIPKHALTAAGSTTVAAPRRNSMIVYANVNPAGQPPPPSGSPPTSWKNWVIGLLLTFIIPFFTTKGGPIKVLMQKVDHMVDTAEHIAEVVETVAEKVDKAVDEISDELPEGSKIKKSLDFIDSVAERVEKDARMADDFIDKVQEMEDKMEDLLDPVLNEAKEVAKVQTKEKPK